MPGTVGQLPHRLQPRFRHGAIKLVPQVHVRRGELQRVAQHRRLGSWDTTTDFRRPLIAGQNERRGKLRQEPGVATPGGQAGGDSGLGSLSWSGREPRRQFGHTAGDESQSLRERRRRAIGVAAACRRREHRAGHGQAMLPAEIRQPLGAGIECEPGGRRRLHTAVCVGL